MIVYIKNLKIILISIVGKHNLSSITKYIFFNTLHSYTFSFLTLMSCNTCVIFHLSPARLRYNPANLNRHSTHCFGRWPTNGVKRAEFAVVTFLINIRVGEVRSTSRTYRIPCLWYVRLIYHINICCLITFK